MLRGIKFISSTIDAKSRPWCRLSISTTEFNVQRDNNCCMVAVKLGAAMQSEICIDVSQEGDSVPFLSITNVLFLVSPTYLLASLILLIASLVGACTLARGSCLACTRSAADRGILGL